VAAFIRHSFNQLPFGHKNESPPARGSRSLARPAPLLFNTNGSSAQPESLGIERVDRVREGIAKKAKWFAKSGETRRDWKGFIAQ
jgi:hypothetical protein